MSYVSEEISLPQHECHKTSHNFQKTKSRHDGYSLDSGCVNTITCTIKVSGLKEGELLCGYETTLRLLLFELHIGSRVNFERLFLFFYVTSHPVPSEVSSRCRRGGSSRKLTRSNKAYTVTQAGAADTLVVSCRWPLILPVCTKSLCLVTSAKGLWLVAHGPWAEVLRLAQWHMTCEGWRGESIRKRTRANTTGGVSQDSLAGNVLGILRKIQTFLAHFSELPTRIPVSREFTNLGKLTPLRGHP